MQGHILFYAVISIVTLAAFCVFLIDTRKHYTAWKEGGRFDFIAMITAALATLAMLYVFLCSSSGALRDLRAPVRDYKEKIEQKYERFNEQLKHGPIFIPSRSAHADFDGFLHSYA